LGESKDQLRRDLTLTDATALVVGVVIGTGIFLKTAVMTQEVGSPALVLAAWVVAGLLTLAGALTYAELGAMMPHAGGEYVYIREAYGELPGFFTGWTRFVVGAGSNGAYGAAFATFLSALVPLGAAWSERTLHLLGQDVLWQFGPRQIVAVTIVLLFTAVNCFGVAVGGRVQTALTLAKLLPIGVLIFGLFFFSENGSWTNLTASPASSARGGLAGFGAAMLAALWAFSGWHYMPMAAGEIQMPGRNVPRALGAGMVAVLLVYGLINLAYFYGLPTEHVATASSARYPDAPSIAVRAAGTFLGPAGTAFISLAFLFSTMGSLNGTLLSVPRMFFSMARDGLFFSRFGSLARGVHAPAWSVALYGAWASLFALLGTFDQLTNLAIFSNLIFWAMASATVFVFRHRRPEAVRPYRTVGYPVAPAAYILLSLWLIWNTMQTNPVESGVALLLMALGLPPYFFFRRRRRTAAANLAMTAKSVAPS
jgi:APA family basic amino acid/polyamine antiporter